MLKNVLGNFKPILEKRLKYKWYLYFVTNTSINKSTKMKENMGGLVDVLGNAQNFDASPE